MRYLWNSAAGLALAALVAVGWMLGAHDQPQAPPGPIKFPLKCYPVLDKPAPPNPGQDIAITTQFSSSGPTVRQAKFLCGPVREKVRKDGQPPKKVVRGDHLHCYDIDGQRPPGQVFVSTQFHDAMPVNLDKATCLCEPTDKNETAGPSDGGGGVIRDVCGGRPADNGNGDGGG